MENIRRIFLKATDDKRTKAGTRQKQEGARSQGRVAYADKHAKAPGT